MANKVRYRSGQVHLISVRVDAGTVIEVGDLLFLDTDDAKPASAFPWNTNLATTQSDFAAQFLGVAHEQSKSGDTDLISVDIGADAVYEFDAASGTYEVGDTLGPDKDTGNQLLDQQLEAAVGTSSIARAVEVKVSAATSLRVTLASAYYTGSGNVNAQVG